MTRISILRIAALVAACTWLAAPPPAAAQSSQPVPRLEARVTDLTGTLTSAEQARLEARLADFEAKKGAQIAVLIVPSTRPEEIEQYSIRVVEAWKLGREKPDDGALLLIAKEDRALRIEVGRGFEGALTDLVSKRIISDTITPLFRQGDFAGGISAGVEQMIRVIEGEPLPAPDPQWQGTASGLTARLPFLLALVFVGSTVLRALLGRALGSVATGVAAGTIAWWLTKLLGLAIGIGIVGLFVALMLGFGGGGRWASVPRHGGWSSGGWGRGGGFGGGAGRGGGFGGGGGSFGGGGASGRW
jgi:uncharacterized protein